MNLLPTNGPGPRAGMGKRRHYRNLFLMSRDFIRIFLLFFESPISDFQFGNSGFKAASFVVQSVQLLDTCVKEDGQHWRSWN